MDAMRSLAQVEQEIAETKEALLNVQGTETEVYARIVGYYRAVKHWNKGKRDEFEMRKLFTLEDSLKHDISIPEITKKQEDSNQNIPLMMDSESSSYEMYTKTTCPNCPPVKEFMSSVNMPGRAINVDTKEGLAEAAKKGVFASPTVIFYNKAGIETARCHNVEELEAVLNKVPVSA